MRPIHRPLAHRWLVAAALTGPALGLAACSGSSGAASAASPSPTSTKPAHDYRNIPELEQLVTDEFNKAYADPTDAKYAPGVTVKKVGCVQEPGTSAYDCLVTPSKGNALKWAYIVAEDGGSVEHGVQRG